ncbi:hypothetical protein H2199_002807 [Coniosporium tulheliwenetii]|uniref:Uncharacterized protein n=1 Tax=Coniosporium tulheliwenetii TaxID=3383036 RepID=A0ACC2ZDG4_9PEZI|nr:hypothetical protein H2199_002807 [Cladosporium sp. JES 115]
MSTPAAPPTNGGSAEEDRFWQACCELGFFYIDLRTGGQSTDEIDGEALLQDAEKLFQVQEEFFGLPLEEKLKYDFKEQGSYFGYKGYGGGLVDKSGTPDRNEFYNTSKDDILGLSSPSPPLPT